MNLIHSRDAVTAELFDNPSFLDPSDYRAKPKVLLLCLVLGLRVGGTEEIFEVFFQPSNCMLS